MKCIKCWNKEVKYIIYKGNKEYPLCEKCKNSTIIKDMLKNNWKLKEK